MAITGKMILIAFVALAIGMANGQAEAGVRGFVGKKNNTLPVEGKIGYCV